MEGHPNHFSLDSFQRRRHAFEPPSLGSERYIVFLERSDNGARLRGAKLLPHLAKLSLTLLLNSFWGSLLDRCAVYLP